jgi:hypothetical protein
LAASFWLLSLSPDHPARPSQYDLDHAWPNFAYVIVAVAAGRAGDMTVWWLKDDRSNFEEGELQHGDENTDSDTAPAVPIRRTRSRPTARPWAN